MATNIQFLRSTTKNLRPDPTRLSLGTPMVNLHPDDPGLYFRLSDDKLGKFGPIHVGRFPPNDNPVGTPGNLVGELWVDTSQSEAHWKYFDGNGWLPITSGQNVPDIGNYPPGAPQPGDFWYDLSNEILFMWDGFKWLDVQKKAAGTQYTVQFNDGGEFQGTSEFTYDSLTNTLSVPKIEFENDTSISGVHGYDGYIQFNYDDTLSSSVLLQWDVINTTFTAAGNVVLGRSQQNHITTSWNNTTFKRSIMVDGDSEFYGSLTVDHDLTVGRSATFGPDHTETFTVKSTAFFENNVTVGNDRGDTFHSYGVSDLSGDVKIGTAGNDDELIINSAETHIDGNVKLENNATLEQWYLERLSNVDADAALQGSVLQKVGNNWMPADPVVIGSQTRFKQFIDVSQPNGGGWDYGDILIQHTANQSTVTADASWAGIAGSTIDEGTYIILSTDGDWYAGGSSVVVEQSDWAENNVSKGSYILNKPTSLSDFNNDVVNDKELVISSGSSAIVIAGDTFTTNAGANKTKTIDLNKSVLDGWYAPIGLAVNDSTITLTGGNGIKTNGVHPTTNQSSGSNTNFEVDYVANGGLKIDGAKLTLDKTLLDSWYANQAGTPANDGDIKVEAGTGLSATGQNATADQAINTTRTLSLNVDPNSALSVDANNRLTIDTSSFINSVGPGLKDYNNGGAQLDVASGTILSISGNQLTADTSSFFNSTGNGIAATNQQISVDLKAGTILSFDNGKLDADTSSFFISATNGITATGQTISIDLAAGTILSIDGNSKLTADTSSFITSASNPLSITNSVISLNVDLSSPLLIDAQGKLSMDTSGLTVSNGRGLDYDSNSKLQIAAPPVDSHYYAWTVNNGFTAVGTSGAATSANWQKTVPYNFNVLPTLP